MPRVPAESGRSRFWGDTNRTVLYHQVHEVHNLDEDKATMAVREELTGEDERVYIWLEEPDAELLAWIMISHRELGFVGKGQALLRRISMDRLLPSTSHLPRRYRAPRRRRNVRSGPRKARAPSGDDPSGDGGEPEPSSGCSPSPQPVDFVDALALSLGWGRV